MAAKICADIKAVGWRQYDLVNLLYALTYSLQGLCDKLDADDAAVTTYASGCFDAVFNCSIRNYKDDKVENYLNESSTILPYKQISVVGLNDKQLIDWMYEWVYCLYLICVKLDASAGVNDTTYTANAYTAILTQRIENSKGNITGAGTGFTFRPAAGVLNQKEFIDFLYNAAYALHILTAQLDADATLTDTDYEALWYTATITLTIENSAGSRIGN